MSKKRKNYIIILIVLISAGVIFQFNSVKYTKPTTIPNPQTSNKDDTIEVPVIGHIRFYTVPYARKKYPIITGTSYNPDNNFETNSIEKYASIYNFETKPYITITLDKKSFLKILGYKTAAVKFGDYSETFQYESFLGVNSDSEEEKEYLEYFNNDSNETNKDELIVQFKDANEAGYSVFTKYSRKK